MLPLVASVIQYFGTAVGKTAFDQFKTIVLRRYGLSGSPSPASDTTIEKIFADRDLDEFSAAWRALRDASLSGPKNRAAILHSALGHLRPLIERFRRPGRASNRANSELLSLACVCATATCAALDEESLCRAYMAEAIVADRNIASRFFDAESGGALVERILSDVGAPRRPPKPLLSPHPPEQPRKPDFPEEPPVWLTTGCGCVLLAAVGFIVAVLIAVAEHRTI